MITWSSIDTVLLDMDGTLLDLHFDNYFWQHYVPECYARKHGLSVAESQTLLYPRLEAEHGKLNWYCLDHWSRELGLAIADLKHEVRHLIRMRVDALDFLEQLQRSRKQVWLVTNAHPDALNLKLSSTGIAPYFHHILSSHQFGWPKEHPEFWHALVAHVPFEPARALFIDDSEPILAAAGRFGIGHLLSIEQPDSQAAPRSGLRFPAIRLFADILPVQG